MVITLNAKLLSRWQVLQVLVSKRKARLNSFTSLWIIARLMLSNGGKIMGMDFISGRSVSISRAVCTVSLISPNSKLASGQLPLIPANHSLAWLSWILIISSPKPGLYIISFIPWMESCKALTWDCSCCTALELLPEEEQRTRLKLRIIAEMTYTHFIFFCITETLYSLKLHLFIIWLLLPACRQAGLLFQLQYPYFSCQRLRRYFRNSSSRAFLPGSYNLRPLISLGRYSCGEKFFS